MFNVGGQELLIIFLVALIVLGPTRLPEVARQAGKLYGDFKRVSSGFQRDFQQAMRDPVGDAIRDVTATAELAEIEQAKSAATDESVAEETVGSDTEVTEVVVQDDAVDDTPDEPLDDELPPIESDR